MARMLTTTVAVIMAALLVCAACATSLPIVMKAHRLLQYDSVLVGRILGLTERHGSGKSSMRGTATSNVNDFLHGAKPLVLEAAELPDDSIADLVKTALGGIVLLLPPDEAGYDAAWAKVRAFEVAAASNAAAGAIYAVEHTNASHFRTRSFADVQLLATADPPKARTAESSTPVVTLTSDVVLPAAKGTTLVIQGGFDTLGAFPSLPQRGVSSAVVVAELASMFAGQQTMALKRIGLTFMASSGDRQSYHALKKWVANGTDSNAVLDKAEFVLCLDDSVLDDGEFSLHSTRPGWKDATLDLVAKAFDAVIKANKIDPASVEIRHGHEVFAHKGHSAGTLAVGPGTARQVLRTTIARSADAINAARVVSVANRLAKAITTYTGIEPQEPAKIARVQGLLANLAANGPRPSYAMPPQVVGEFNRLLSAAAAMKNGKPGRARRATYPFAPPEATFYTPEEALITAYPAQPLIFELSITAVIVATLVVSSFAILGAKGAWGFWTSPMRPPKRTAKA